MTFTITLDYWLMLPLAITAVLLAGGLWLDRPCWEEVEGTLIALVACVLLWVPVLYGRYERWLVMPALFTLYIAWAIFKDRSEARLPGVAVALKLLAGLWALVLYGRFTA